MLLVSLNNIVIDVLSFQAFLELQGKMQETNQKLRIADVQVESLKKQIVHAQLTDKEIQVEHKRAAFSYFYFL